MTVTEQRYPFAFDPRFAWLLRLGGITPQSATVVVGEDRLRVRFGRLRVDTPLDNLREVRITRGYRWFRAIGPRASLADRGASFGTNAQAGVCICFYEPVTAMFGRVVRHPALTVTVADLDGLAATLQQHIDRQHGQ